MDDVPGKILDSILFISGLYNFIILKIALGFIIDTVVKAFVKALNSELHKHSV